MARNANTPGAGAAAPAQSSGSPGGRREIRRTAVGELRAGAPPRYPRPRAINLDRVSTEDSQPNARAPPGQLGGAPSRAAASAAMARRPEDAPRARRELRADELTL